MNRQFPGARQKVNISKTTFFQLAICWWKQIHGTGAEREFNPFCVLELAKDDTVGGPVWGFSSYKQLWPWWFHGRKLDGETDNYFGHLSLHKYTPFCLRRFVFGSSNLQKIGKKRTPLVSQTMKGCYKSIPHSRATEFLKSSNKTDKQKNCCFKINVPGRLPCRYEKRIGRYQ